MRSLGSGVSPDGWVRLDPSLGAAAGPGSRLLADGLFEWSGPPNWDGKNDAGQGVALGTYYVKLEILDPFGAVTAYSQAVQLASRPAPALITVFNAAGEAVRRAGLDLGAAGPWDIELEQDQLVLQAGPVSGKLELKLRGSGEPPAQWAWDGRGDNGALVSPGSYVVQLESGEPESRRLVSKGVLVLAAPPALGLLQAYGPDVAGQRLLAQGWPGAGAFHLRLYSLSGELVALAQAGDGGLASLDCHALARGIYLLEAGTQPGAPASLREIKKVALTR